ncbi:PMS1 protein homolog 1-like isoform X2 [Oratosquilla oratoria]|uniref:PMS1 protein homolog 1-like isoform X2 n=1 Tax=Oratosquilla oratoria TaxID=337810 RepID=UPI003F7723E5
MVIEELPSGTVRLLKSTQVITSLKSVVKELVENSLDAEATALTLKLDNYGFNRFEIRDNGPGIGPDDIQFVAKQHYTSKIKSFSDLASLISYGFRGEALASLCAVADVSITTKTRTQDVGHTYTFDHQGNVNSTKPAATPVGTTIVVTNLFKNLPVRRQYYNNTKRRKDELKMVEETMMAFAMAVPAVHVSLYHDRHLIFQKVSAQDFRGSVLNTLPSVGNKLVHASAEEEQTKVVVFLPPALGRDVPNFSRSTPDRLFVFVNDRHVRHKSIEKVVKAHFGQSMDNCHSRYPIGMVSASVPPHLIDVNLEPNKDKVLLHEEETVISLLIKVLEDMYGVLQKSQNAKDIKEKKNVCEDITCTYAAATQAQNKESEKENVSVNVQTKDKESFLDGPVRVGCLNDQREKIVNVIENGERTEGSNKSLPKPLVSKPQVSTQNSNDGSILEKGNGKVPFSASLSSIEPEDYMAELRNTWDSDFFNMSAGFQSGAKPSLVQAEEMKSAEKKQRDNLENNFAHENSGEQLQNKINHSEENLDHENQKRPVHEEARNDANQGHKENSSSEQPMNGKLHVTLEGEDGVPVFVIPQLDRSKAFDDDSFIRKENMEILVNNAGSDLKMESKEASEVQQNNFREVDNQKDKDMLQKETPALEKGIENGAIAHSHQQNITTTVPQERSFHKENPLGTTTDLDDQNAWSRGLLKGAESDNVQTISLAKPPVLSLSNSKAALIGAQKRPYPDSKTYDGVSKGASTKGVKKACLSSVGVANYDYINGKPLKKPASAFILFSREIRGKVLSEFPGQDFAFIAKELAARWKNLDKDEKEKYEKIAHRDQERYQREWKQINSNRGFASASPNSSVNRSTLDRFVAPTPLTNTSLNANIQIRREEQKCREVKINIEKIHKILKEREKSVLGRSNWETLLILKKEVSPTTKVATIKDPRITANGFKVNLYPSSHNLEELSHGELVALSDCIGFYGLLDLQEVLATLTTNPAAPLQQTRPVKVRHWMQGEAVRLSRTSPIARNRQELFEKLMEHLTKEKVDLTTPPYHLKCLHNKPLLNSIYSLDDLPQSQDNTLLSQSVTESSLLEQ